MTLKVSGAYGCQVVLQWSYDRVETPDVGMPRYRAIPPYLALQLSRQLADAAQEAVKAMAFGDTPLPLELAAACAAQAEGRAEPTGS